MIKHLIFASSIILIAALSRLLPHPPNVAPIAALALAGGIYVANRRWSLLVPALALLLSDALIGFHQLMPFVYGSFALTAILGQWVRGHRTVGTIAAATVGGSILFFIVTNFGVWLMADGAIYPRNAAGLLECYVAAIPFFRNTLLGDAAYTAVLCGVFELSRRELPALMPRVVDARD